ncbi:hypothetical protein DM01DRAFT_1339516 [Hesseltinella vesiculosa]|uniref:Uncharacterized protein n=1 Tax=Hesseltinella vesiculosa TaxID=101127 RepID=A0A1X2G6R0_9FUNG|nr:hypothetical protein DM01DRAFT_1339516 [Hesseltinella vesiculosa]
MSTRRSTRLQKKKAVESASKKDPPSVASRTGSNQPSTPFKRPTKKRSHNSHDQPGRPSKKKQPHTNAALAQAVSDNTSSSLRQAACATSKPSYESQSIATIATALSSPSVSTIHDKDQPMAYAALDGSSFAQPLLWPTDQLNDDDMVEALFNIANIDDMILDRFPTDRKAAKDALDINQQLQELVQQQIVLVDQRIAKNQQFMRDVRLLSIQEARAQRDKTDIHRAYDESYEVFADADGQIPDLEGYWEKNVLDTERSRSWHTRERELLFEGIHHEVQRNMAFEHISRQEPWRVWEVDKLPRTVWENYPVNRLDWGRVANHVKSRTSLECMIQWTTQDHPSINKLPWSKKETEKLVELVKKHGYHGQWEHIASELNTERTASQCFSHYQAEFNTRSARKKWTKEDDEALTKAVNVLGDRNWQEIATLVGGRSGQQCLHRWLKSINPAIRRSPWNKEEDDALRGAVAVYGIGHWTKVQRHIPGRTDMQCRERWVNVLDDNLKFGPFSEEENALLVKLVAEHGRKWSYLSQFIPGRTDNSLLRQWRVLERIESQAKEAAPPTPSSSSTSTSTSTVTPAPIPPSLKKAPTKRRKAAAKRKPPTKTAPAAPTVARSLRSRKGKQPATSI